MDIVQIGGPETRLELVCLERFADGSARLIRAGVHAPRVLVEVDVYEDSGYENLARFFEALAESWRGWDGQRSYESIEGDLELVARHDGHIRLGVSLTPYPAWNLSSGLVLEAGEELDLAAHAVRALVGKRHP